MKVEMLNGRLMFADDNVLLGDSGGKLGRLVQEFESMSKEKVAVE